MLATWFGVGDLGGAVGTLYTALGFGALAGPAVLGFVVDGVSYEAAAAIVIVTSAVALFICLSAIGITSDRAAIELERS